MTTIPQEVLIKNVLSSLLTSSDPVTVQKSRYVEIAISLLDEFSLLYAATQSGSDGSAWLTSIDSSDTLTACERLPYALFVHRLFLHGECYGMVHEDPANALVILSSATTALSVYLEEEVELIAVHLDLLLYKATAYKKLGEFTLAKRTLRRIIELGAEVDSSYRNLEVGAARSAKEVAVDIQSRAAPSAWILAHMLKNEDEDESADNALKLAHTLYEEILENKLFPSKGIERVTALLGLAETSMAKELMDKSMLALKRATKVAEKDLAKKYSAAYAFVASTAYHKRAEVYAISYSWKKATDCFARAMYWCEKAIATSPGNTHYEDTYPDYMNGMGVIYGMAGNLPEAQKMFLKSIDVRRKLAEKSEQYKTSLASTLNNMAILMRKYGNNQVAKAYVLESINVLDSITDTSFVGYDGFRMMLVDGLESIEKEIKTQSLASWRPIWNPSPSSSGPN